MSVWKAGIAAKLFPLHIDLLDKINGNALVRRWIAEQRGRIPTFKHLHDFYRYVHGEVCGGTAIDFLEFGVYKGDSIRFWSQINRDPRSRFIGFDSFEGLPENWTKKVTKGGRCDAADRRRKSQLRQRLVPEHPARLSERVHA